MCVFDLPQFKYCAHISRNTLLVPSYSNYYNSHCYMTAFVLINAPELFGALRTVSCNISGPDKKGYNGQLGIIFLTAKKIPHKL